MEAIDTCLDIIHTELLQIVLAEIFDKSNIQCFKLDIDDGRKVGCRWDDWKINSSCVEVDDKCIDIVEAVNENLEDGFIFQKLIKNQQFLSLILASFYLQNKRPDTIKFYRDEKRNDTGESFFTECFIDWT